MDQSRVLGLLQRQRDELSQLKNSSYDNSDFIKWRRDTRVVLTKLFGDESDHVNELAGIRFVSVNSAYDREEYKRGVMRADTLLQSIIREVSEFGGPQSYPGKSEVPALYIVENICKRFHTVARQLNSRHDDRPTLDVADEYDVQDLMHALLRLHFDDIREEEWTPSFAGASSRQDFLLKNERIVIEVKKTRPTLKAKQLGEELLIDIARYRSHPDCDCLVCFVYDPDARIVNPTGLERDLESQSSEKLKVQVIIRPNS